MATPAPVPPPTAEAQTNVSIPVGGGVELVGDLYVPRGQPPFPAVLQITPYKAQDLAGLGRVYAGRGYLFLAVDARGRYRSGGDWDPLTHDQADGHAVISWLAGHPLCNARVGSRGHSYCGYNQLLAAIDAPPALQAMVACVAPGDPFVNVPFVGGAYDLSDLLWLLGMTGRVCQDETPDEDFGIRRFGTHDTEQNPYLADPPAGDPPDPAALAALQAQWHDALRARPFRDVDLRLGVRHQSFREWLQHWRLDDYWRARSLGQRAERIRVPTLFISGWWDNNGRGATQFFPALAGDTPRRLLMGPWNHALKVPDCADLPAAEAQWLERAAARDELNDEFAWLDQHLRDCPPGPATAARASLFITGLYRWLDFPDWPPPHTVEQAYYLHGADRGSGRLVPAPAERGGSSAYRFDPQDPTPFAASPLHGERSPFDNAALPEARTDLLVFESAPLAQPLALVGECAALLYAEADAPDFDLCVKLLDLYPDGRAIYLTDGVLRARFRPGWDRPTPVEPGQVQAYRIDLWHLGHVLLPGHALRLEVASAAFPRIDVNPCTGGDLGTETGSRPVQVRLHHSAQYPSQLLLPRCDDPRLLDPELQ
ncbi:MAG: hypothetical protein RLZ44_965 [Pseudomonadota bacterium]